MKDVNNITYKDFKNKREQLIDYNKLDLLHLPIPKEPAFEEPAFPDPKPAWLENHDFTLDGAVAFDDFTLPQTEAEKKELVKKFVAGFQKLFMAETNKGFLQPLQLSMEYCAKCNTCSEACHIFEATGRNEMFRPLFRSQLLRDMFKKYGRMDPAKAAETLDWDEVYRLGELAYRCNLCRRCAQTCPLGLDNAVIAREIRAIFSMEMGIAPLPLHEKGTVLQMKTGSSTGITRPAFLDIIEFMEDDIEEKYGKRIKIPIDKKGADILLTHNAGEFMAWPENPAAFAILFEEAGLDWTLSSDLIGYDNVNYGIWYDDTQTKKVAYMQRKAAIDLGVNRIVLGECGHAHRASMVSSDRTITDKDYIPRESCLPLLRDLVVSGALKFDPSRNNFPVTLHDPCNFVRSMGIVMPQREVLHVIAPQFREMTPHGVNNYCCGGGSGFAIMQSLNFDHFRNKISTRKKYEQILRAFEKEMDDPTIPKYICAPCSNCKGAIRDMLAYHKATQLYNLQYGGLVELMVNALTTATKPYLEFLEEF